LTLPILHIPFHHHNSLRIPQSELAEGRSGTGGDKRAFSGVKIRDWALAEVGAVIREEE
jgi:hypothetical protein